jgi:hypothetical protein
MKNSKQVFLALLLALLFILPPAAMLQNDSEDREIIPAVESVLTNEEGADTAPDADSSDTESDDLTLEDEVNVEGDRSSKKFLNAFKLNFDPFDPEDGEEVECTATVHNFGTERQVAYNVNVEFWVEDNYIGTDTIDEIQPGENGTASVSWKALFGSHVMSTIADPDGSDGGPDDYSVLLNVTRSEYSPVLELYQNDSWIKNSDSNVYYIKVTNQGENSDTIDLDFEITKYGNDGNGWDISLSEDSVTLDGGESTYVELTVEYTMLTPDYTAEAVVKVMAESQSDSERSFEIYTTTNVIHDVPIIYLDDDGQHTDQPRMSYSVISGQYGPETDEINLAALEANYPGMYHHLELPADLTYSGDVSDQGASGPPYDSTSGISTYTIDGERVYLSDYDIVIWDTGYVETMTASGTAYDRSSETHAWYDQTEIMKFMDNGGSFIWLSNKGIEYHDTNAGTFTNPLYTDYFNVERAVQQGGLQYQIIGSTQHPVGRGIDVENTFIYSVAGDRSDSFWPGEGAEGIYYSGTSYTTVGHERSRVSSSEQRFKAIVQTTQWASFGGSYWHYYRDASPMREKAVQQSMTWLGVPMRIAGEYDLEIESIASPLGKYVEPNEEIPLAVNVKNVGNKEITQQFSVVFKVLDMDNGNSVKFQRTLSVDDDLAPGEVLKVEAMWSSSKPSSGGHYNVTFKIENEGDNGYDDNNQAYTHQEGKLVKDVMVETANYEKFTFYWNSTRIGEPTEVWTVVANNGSVVASFDVNLVIMSPLNTEVFSKTTRVNNLAPGEEKKISWIWTPRNPGGYLTNWHFGVNDRAHRDQYEATFSVDWSEDEYLDNNEEGIGTTQAHGIVVMGYSDLSEPRLMSEDWAQADLNDHDNHGNDIEDTPFGLQSIGYVSPTHAWGGGYGYEDGSRPTIKDGWHTVAVSPMIDLTKYTEARFNWLYGGFSGGTIYCEISRDYDGNIENVESATWNGVTQTAGGSSWGWYINTAGIAIDQYCGDEIYMRLRFDSNADTIGSPFVDEIAICGLVDQYNSNDLGVTMVTISPLIDEKEQARDITVTVENFGENKTNSGEQPGFEIEVRVEDDEGTETYRESVYVSDVLGIGDTVTAAFDGGSGKDWVPEENGLYMIYATVIWEKDDETIDENPNNDVMAIDGVVQRDFFSDDMDSGAGDWVAQGDDDGWELGTPEGSMSPTPHSGDSCWATNLDGNYPDLSDHSITLEHYIDLRTAMDPTLSFWHWLEVEAHEYDTAYVEVRTAEQSSYTIIWENPSPDRQGIPFKTNGWDILTLSLEDFAYSEVYIRFRLQTDGDVNHLGWYIDDVGVGGTTPPQYDARLVSINYPAEGEYIPPSETIEISATVMNVGLYPDVVDVKGKAIRQGSTPIEFTFEDQSTDGVLEPGQKEEVKFTWQLPIGTYQYRIEIWTDLDNDENEENDMIERFIWAKEVFDISVLSVYADPMVQDVARTRTVIAEVQNVGNVELINNVEITFEVMFEGQKVDEYTTVVSLARGEISPVSWEWQSFKYGEYEIEVMGRILQEADADMGNNNANLDGIITVETIFSDTREEGDSPAYLDADTGEFKVWDWVEEGTTFWSGDNESDPNVAGWHVVDTGHFSRTSWYAGIPARDRYSNNMKSELISEPLNLEGYTNVHLSFFTKYVIEGRLYDYVDISVSDDATDEDSWQRLVKYPEDHQSHDSSREADSTYGWLHKDIVIPDTYLSDTFYIKILMKSDNGITYQGVFIDDITIYGKTTGNHAPVARFTAKAEDENESYSRKVIQSPPVGLFQIKGNYAFNNLPRPVGNKQGGIQLGKEIQFNADLSFDPDAGDDSISYKWFMGDGTTLDGKSVTYAYTGDLPLEGFFRVTLRVKDDLDFQSEDTLLIWIGNKAPVADFIVTSSYDTSTPISDENDRVANEIIDVFYGDSLIFQQRSTDPENDPMSYSWQFYCNPTKFITEGVGDTVSGVVGTDFLFEGLDGSEPIIPVSTVDYEVTIYVTDGVSISEMAYTIRVHPYATADFVKPVNLGSTILDATVTLTWRGFPEEAAPQASLISQDRPVYVHIDDSATSPDLNLANRGGIGKVYEIRSEGCTLQNGDDGFISAEISLPILTDDLNLLGDSFSLQDDLRLEFYDELEKRFVAVYGSQVIADGGVKYVVGEVDHFSIYTAIVDSIYNTGNDNYAVVLPDLQVTQIQFSRSPAQNGQEVEIRAFIKNTGKTHARNVDVKLYDGDDLVGDVRIDLVPASGIQTIVVSETFTIAMLDSTQPFENHNVKCYVNKQRAINEGSANYKNNEKNQLLVVTSVQQTSPSFELTFMMMGISAALVAMGSSAVLRKGTRKREEE